MTVFAPPFDDPGSAAASGLLIGGEPDPTVLTLPAAWRDLFYKSGRILDAELGKRGLELRPAPPRPYRFADGSTLALPSDRGKQWQLILDAFGENTAIAWRDLLDDLDQTWQLLRPLGLEAEFTGSREQSRVIRSRLKPVASLAQVAHALPDPHLAEIVLDVAARLNQAPNRLPGWHAARLAVERIFGRWQIQDNHGVPHPVTVLHQLLGQRLERNQVRFVTDPVVAIRPEAGALICETASQGHRAAVMVSTLTPAQHASLTRHPKDLRAAGAVDEAPGGGPRWESWRTLERLPRLDSGLPGVVTASAWSPGGADPWAQLLTGALASYRVHSWVTGQDIRPTNKNYRRPRPIPRATDGRGIPGR